MTTTKKTAAGKAPPVDKQVEATVNAGKETMEAAVKATTEAAAQGYEKAVAMTQEHVDAAIRAGTEFFANSEELFAFGKDNVDAVMQSGSLWVKGVQDLNKTIFGMAQASMEDGVAVTKALFGAKTLADVVKIQNDYARASYEKAVSESRRIADLSVEVAEGATAPIGKRVEATIDKISTQIAA